MSLSYARTYLFHFLSAATSETAEIAFMTYIVANTIRSRRPSAVDGNQWIGLGTVVGDRPDSGRTIVYVRVLRTLDESSTGRQHHDSHM